jgi:hypothetical protein
VNRHRHCFRSWPSSMQRRLVRLQM